MSISAALVKELRERTGAGMMECKKSLVEANGDIDKAIELMRKSGQAKAVKKAGRTAAEGAIVIESNDKSAVIVEINSETDFVAKDENFTKFAKRVAEIALETKAGSVEQLSASVFNGGETIEQARQALVSKIGENIQIRRLAVIDGQDNVGAYLHGGRIGVIVALAGGDLDLAKDIAMHVAASAPVVVNKEDVSEDLVNKEKEIFAAQAAESGKPPEIIEKMIGGRINKFLEEICLVGQPFVKDPSTKVGKLLEDKKAEVVSFTRFQVGEGIEKEADDFVAEVMAQVKEH